MALVIDSILEDAEGIRIVLKMSNNASRHVVNISVYHFFTIFNYYKLGTEREVYPHDLDITFLLSPIPIDWYKS